MQINIAKEQQASELKGSLLLFTRFFFKHLTGREFIVSQPIGRESHHIAICRAYTELFWNPKPSYGLLINIPPGYGKSVLTCMFIAWCYAHYPDCNFLYISYSHDLAAKHTSFIKQIMSSKMYQFLFEVYIRSDTRAKDKFSTTQNGSIQAFGTSGSVTGMDAGLPGLNRFSGMPFIDDAHKPDEVHSATTRATVIRNYQETILQRPRDTNVPIGFIGQRLHEDDMANYLLSGQDVRSWDSIVLPGLDATGNALYPEVQSREYLLELQDKQPYVFSAQIQQSPIPAGGSLFKPEWFVMLDEEPIMLATFITADTAETNKSYNDATVFSFFGLYEVEYMGKKTGDYALHWLDCAELRLEPKDLKDNFIDFYTECMRHPVTPKIAAIEKKSTGVTLVSVLQDLRGITIRQIERTRASGSKTQRFLETQPYVAKKLISFTDRARHAKMCIDHMSRITANDSHRWDDIADTVADAVRLALIDKSVYSMDRANNERTSIVQQVNSSLQRKLSLGMTRHGGSGKKNW